jgi:hypothetical protein
MLVLVAGCFPKPVQVDDLAVPGAVMSLQLTPATGKNDTLLAGGSLLVLEKTAFSLRSHSAFIFQI